MPNCASIEPLVTPYVDGELGSSECQTLEQHLDRCSPCRGRIGAERAVRELLQARKMALHHQCAPGALRARCASLARTDGAAPSPARRGFRAFKPFTARLAPLAVAATLILVVGVAFAYRATGSSSALMAAELTADHIKCFTMNAVLRTQQSPAAVESQLASGFNWNVHLPENAEREGLELVGSRPCVYHDGKVAHIMYRHNGRPVSLFMLPRTRRPDQLVKVLGHEAAIWSVGDRTFVLVAREPRSEIERMAAFVHAAIQ